MTARIKISQAGLAAGVAGRSRTDGLATGALVTLEDVGGAGAGASSFHLLWGPVEDTTAEASLAVTGDLDIWTFSPTAAAYGSYEIELREDGVPVERRVFGIRTPANQLLIPALNERASRHAGWHNDGADQIELCEQNANDFPLSVLNSFRYAGWWRSLYELYRVVEFGIGSIANHALALVKLVTVPAKSFLTNPTNATGDVTATLAGSAALQYPRVNAANNALEMATLATHASTSLVYDGGTNTFQAAAKTGVVTAGQNSNAFAFGTIAAKSVLANTTNATAAPAASAPTSPLKFLRSNAAFTALEWAGEAGAVETTANTVTNGVGSIDLTGTLAIPANTLAANSRFRFKGSMRYTRGATATAHNLLADLDVGGTALTTPAIAANVTNGFTGSVNVEGEFTVVTTGAGGTCRAHITASTDCDNVATAGKVVTNFNATLAVNTTISNSVRLLGRMSAAVAATTVLATGGDVVPVN